MRRLLLGLTLLALLSGGCKSKKDATRQAWLDNATACPSPSTCSGKTAADAREVTTCEPAADPKGLTAGEVVVVHDLAGFATVGRVKEVKASGASFDVELPDGVVIERAAPSVLARVCR